MVNNPFTTAACILCFKTQVEHGYAVAPAANHPIESEVAFCVRGVLSPLLSNLVLDDLDKEQPDEVTAFAVTPSTATSAFAASAPANA